MKPPSTWLTLEAGSGRRVGGGGRAAFVAAAGGEKAIAHDQSGRASRVTPSATPAASGSSWRLGAPRVVAGAPSSAPDNEERGAEEGAPREVSRGCRDREAAHLRPGPPRLLVCVTCTLAGAPDAGWSR